MRSRKDGPHECESNLGHIRMKRRFPMSDKRDARNEVASDRIVEKLQFNLIFSVTFLVLSVVALITLLMPWTWQRRFLSGDNKWFVVRAWEDAGTFIELAYMG